MIPSVAPNQNRDIPVSTLPLSGMVVGRTTSKADIRSDATSARRPSGKVYKSRTLPERRKASAASAMLGLRELGRLDRESIGEAVQPGDDRRDVLQERCLVEAGVEPRQ